MKHFTQFNMLLEQEKVMSLSRPATNHKGHPCFGLKKIQHTQCNPNIPQVRPLGQGRMLADLSPTSWK